MMGRAVLRLLLTIAILAVVSAIYPDDHWNYATKLTEDNFDSFIQGEIDQDKTVLVRWIASAGWGWWRKQAPAWNAVVKKFAANTDVAFGDINLSENPIRGNHNPGAGGWPTIRYFNKETGIAGGTYQKKTSQHMCDELGNDEMMTAYVEEYAGTSLCSIVDGTGCSEKEKKYIDKMSSTPFETLQENYTRLQKMSPDSMNGELKDWLNKRKKIIKSLLETLSDEL